MAQCWSLTQLHQTGCNTYHFIAYLTPGIMRMGD